MQDLSEEERRKILEQPPIGTWVLLLSVGFGFTLAWLFLYFGVFLPRGFID